jgi:hypothetical protein
MSNSKSKDCYVELKNKMADKIEAEWELMTWTQFYEKHIR